MKELALQITTDPDHKFDLSLQLDDLDAAVDIAKTVPDLEAEPKWKAIGDRALAVWRFDLAREAFERAKDLNALFLLLLAIGDKDGLLNLATQAEEKGQNNLAFASLLQTGSPAACVDLLIKTHRAPEAAIFARTYAPSKIPEAVTAWKAELKGKGKSKIADSVADPTEHPELFEEGWKDAVAKEEGAELLHPPLPIQCELVFKTLITVVAILIDIPYSFNLNGVCGYGYDGGVRSSRRGGRGRVRRRINVFVAFIVYYFRFVFPE